MRQLTFDDIAPWWGAVEIDVGLSTTMFLVPDIPTGKALVKSGVKRGRVLTSDEVRAMLAVGVTVEDARTVAGAMILMDSGLAAVKRA